MDDSRIAAAGLNRKHPGIQPAITPAGDGPISWLDIPIAFRIGVFSVSVRQPRFIDGSAHVLRTVVDGRTVYAAQSSGKAR